jgi:2-oxoglutarate dehydrogenase E2 component (dihydrolipoamide succinyltransferase)
LCVEAGDFVQADEVVAVIETDKVNVDIRSTHAGVIKKYYANEGDTVQVDANFFEIDTDGKGGAAPAQPAAPQKEAPTAKKVTKILLLIINSGGA